MSEEDLAVEAQTLVAKERGKCRVMVGEEVGGGELGKQVVQHIADSAATCKTTPDANIFTNYRESSRPLGHVDGGTTSIAGYGNLTVAFRCDNGWVHVNLYGVAHIPLLSYNLISLPSLTLKGHTYLGQNNGYILSRRNGRRYISPCLASFAARTGTTQRRRVG